MFVSLLCSDIDECQLGVHSCQQLCTNTDGSFQCGCTAGFQVDSNGSCIGQHLIPAIIFHYFSTAEFVHV